MYEYRDIVRGANISPSNQIVFNKSTELIFFHLHQHNARYLEVAPRACPRGVGSPLYTNDKRYTYTLYNTMSFAMYITTIDFRAVLFVETHPGVHTHTYRQLSTYMHVCIIAHAALLSYCYVCVCVIYPHLSTFLSR